MLLALAAAALLALLVGVWLYRSLLAAGGGYGFDLACGLAVVALAAAAIRLWQRDAGD